MQCLNVKNKKVAALLKEYTDILGSEDAAYYVLSENNGYGIDKAPNGEPSKLFSDLLQYYKGDNTLAIQSKAKTYSENFKEWFGDWVNPLKPGDIVFGHPAIGKTYSLESGKYKDKIIDWDVEFNEKRDKWIEDHSNTVKGTPEYKKARNEYLIYPENHPDYVEFLTEEWERVKSKTKKEGKILFASPHNLLKMFPQDFDRIINLKDEDFVKRNIERGGKERESKLWKEGINNTILNITNIPIEYLNKNQHFEDYLNKYIGVSKVVDENGEPLVVYHGTQTKFTEFSKEKRGTYTGATSAKLAFFAASNKLNSGEYAKLEDLMTATDKLKEAQTFDINLKLEDIGAIDDISDLDIIEEEYFNTITGIQGSYYSLANDYAIYLNSKGESKNIEQTLTINQAEEWVTDKDLNDYKNDGFIITPEQQEAYKRGENIEIVKSTTTPLEGYDVFKRFKENNEFTKAHKEEINRYFNDIKEVNKKYEQSRKEFIASKVETTPYILPLFLNIKNPKIDDDKNKEYRAISYTERISDALQEGKDGGVIKNTKDPLDTDVYYFFEPSQIKSVDNKGSFSNSDNNIYNQKATTKETPTGRNKKLQKILRTLYPQINLSMFSDPHLRGQAILRGNQAGEVLINAALENQDTLPHEYAHHYIAWFRKSPIVQKAIKMFGTEEQLVQAIGENSVKAVNWYNKIWNEIKGLFSKKQATLNKLTKDFLAGKQYTDATEVLEETHYQTIDSAKDKSTVKVMDATYAKLMEALSRRIKDVQYAKPLNSRKIEELRSLEFRLNQMENDKATFEFVSYMNRDVIEALDQITIILDKVREAQKYGKLHDISAAELDLIKKGYIGFYGNIASNIQNMLDDESTFNYINDPELIQTVREQLRITVGNYNEIVRKYNNASDIIAKENFINEATKAGSFTVDELKRILDEGDSDINVWDQWVGSSQYSNSEMIRLMMNKIINIKNKVNELELTRGKEILDLLDKTDRAKVALFHERNKDGKKTGFITRDLNYGQHYQDYLAHQRKLADDLGFGEEDLEAVPSLLNSEQLKTWNKRNNEWEAKHTIRKFKPEYYELTNSLSEETRNFRDEINMEISLILSKTLDENHETHREDLNEMEYKKLEALETRRRNLANPFNLDGTRKVDLYLRVAKEMAIYNKTLREKLEYKTNFEKFNKARNKAKTTLSAEKYKLWIERNTVDKITEKFWEDIKSLSSNNKKSEDQVRWEEARKNMLRLYTNEKGEVDVENMSTAVKGYILAYDEMISDEAIANRDKSKKSGIMNIAEWAVNDAFYVEMERAEAEGEAAFNTWLSYNGRYNSRGEVIPASFWRRLVPKQELRNKYIERIPNRTWSEIDRESPFYDHRFSQYEDRGESRIPNPELYDNSAAYNKITSDTNLKNLYDKLVQTYEDSNNKINILKRGNKFKLAQIEGGAMTRIQSQDNILRGMQTAFKDIYTIKEDDTRYMTENAKRADGSLVKLIPTRYIKMLSDPNMLTNDIVGSTIAYYKMATNYELMSEAAPELEMAMDFVGRMEFKGKKGGKISGVESRTYDKFKFLMDKFVYGMERDAVEVDVPLPNGQVAKVSVDKVIGNLAAYTRIQGISQNINVILTALITNKFQNRLEAISGIYFGNAELAKATKVILPSYASALANIGKSNNKDKVLCYLEFVGLLRDNEQTFGKLNQSRFLRTINQHYWYFGHELTDYVTKGKMALAVAFYNKYNPELGKFQNKNEFLRTYKNKKQGKAAWEALEVGFYDIFEVQNNQLVIKDEFKDIVDDRTINRIRNTTKQIGTRIDTQLTDMDKAKIHSNVLGQLLLIYRNFLLVNLDTKFLTKRQFNYTTGMWSEAQWPAAIKYLRRHFAKDKEKQIRQLQELYKENYESLDDFEKGCLKRVSYELLFSIVGFFLVNSLLRAILDEDKDNWWKQEAAYISMRSALESRSNIVPVEAINLFQSPTAAWSTLESIGGLLNVFDFEEIRRGPYKGITRSQRSLIKITPLRSLYEARDPKSKMEFYENMVSIFPDKPELFSWALK